MGGLYDAATLHAPWYLPHVFFMLELHSGKITTRRHTPPAWRPIQPSCNRPAQHQPPIPHRSHPPGYMGPLVQASKSWAAAGQAAGGWAVSKQDPEFEMRRPLSHRHCVRAVKEMDSKSIGLCPQGFESPRCRLTSLAILPTRAIDANCNLKLRTRPTTTQFAYHGHPPPTWKLPTCTLCWVMMCCARGYP